MPHTIERLHITVAETTYPLAPVERVDDLKNAIVDAVRAGGGFVEMTLDDGHQLSILIVPTTAVVIVAETVTLDASTADGGRCYSTSDAGPVWDGYDDGSPFDLI